MKARAPVPASHVKQLLETNQLEQAVTHALDVWRVSRSTAVAAAIERLDQRFPVDDQGHAAVFHKTWLERAAKPVTAEGVGWLARNLSHKCPIATNLGWPPSPRVKFAALFERLAVIARLPGDPRVSAALVQMVVDGRITAGHSAHEIYLPCADLIIGIGDPRAVDSLRAALADPRAPTEHVREYLGTLLPRVIASLAALRVVEPTDRDAWEALCPAPTISERQRHRARDLVQAVLDDPEDLDARAVCADALLEIGDPRGEFISLQLKNQWTPETRRRARELEKAHSREWLGEDLSAVLTAVVFRNGFPAIATLAPNHAATGAVWQRALEDPRLATLERLLKGKAPKYRYLAFLESPAAKLL